MPVIENDKAFAVATGFIISLLVLAPVLVGQFGWFFAGHVIFGLTVGLMVGMTTKLDVKLPLGALSLKQREP